MGLAKFEVTAEPGGAVVLVNGEDVSGLCHRATVDVAAGSSEVPKLYLEVLSEGAITGEGVVEVRVTKDLDPREVILAWLESLDAQVVENDVLMGTDFGTKAGDAWLETLKGYARGDHNGS